MVWDCISVSSFRIIYFLTKSINAAVYQDVLDYFLIPYIEDKFGDNEFIFQHNLASLYAVKYTKEWFKEKRILVLYWPANSLDVNPIENPLEEIKKILSIKSLRITQVWALVSPEICRDWIDPFQEQIKKIANAIGVTTKY